MSAIAQPPVLVQRLLAPLRRVGHRQWSVLAAKGLLQVLIVALSLVLAVSLGMTRVRYSEAPAALRIAVSAAVAGAVLYAMVRFLAPAGRRRTMVQLAMDVERRLSSTVDTHERISSAVELAGEKDDRFRPSPELLARLMQQAEADVAKLNPQKLVSNKIVTWLGILLVPLLIAWAAAMIVMPQRMLGSLFHLVLPWKELPPALCDVVVQPGDVELAQGDRWEVAAYINPRSASDADRPVKRASLVTVDATGQSTTQALAPVDQNPRQFSLSIDSLQRSFRYRITADEAESPWFNVTVHPRPMIELLTVRYEYPPYMHLESKVEPVGADGAIDVWAGTKVTVVLRTSTALREESRLTVFERNDGKPDAKRTQDFPLQTDAPAAADSSAQRTCRAQFAPASAGYYRIRLFSNVRLNGAYLGNRDDQPRAIRVRPDTSPMVAITSPMPEVAVRPDDVVPVNYQAADDFGIVSAVAVVQGDDGAAQTIPLKMIGDDPHQLAENFSLAVHDLIKQSLPNDKRPDGQRITYWVRVTDGREPGPQSTESEKHVLQIDRTTTSIEQKLDAERAKDLAEAVRAAAGELRDVRPLADEARAVDTERAMAADEKRRAEETRSRLEQTATKLMQAASQHDNDSFAKMAEQAKKIADEPITQAAEQVARTELHSDVADVNPRRQAAAAAVKEIDRAIEQLEELLKQVEQQAGDLDAQHRLEQLAKQQQELADQMAAQNAPAPSAEQPPSDEQAKADQQQVNEQTRETIDQNRSLQDPKAAEQAQKLADLLKKVQDIQKQQDQMKVQVKKQSEMAELQTQAKEIAARQAKLNERIEKFKKESASALHKADGNPPKKAQQNQIVKDLNDNHIAPALKQQKRAAEQLEQTAGQLDQKAQDEKLRPDTKQEQAANERKDAAAKAEALKTQAAAVAEKHKEAKAESDAEKDAAAAQETKQLAADIANKAKQAGDQAKQIGDQAKKTADRASAAAKAGKPHADVAVKLSDNARAKVAEAAKAAESAQESVKSAQKAADNGNADEANEKTEQAANKLADARQKINDAADVAAVADQKLKATDAALVAKELAKEQKAIADAADAPAEQQAKVQKDALSPNEAANRQSQLAQQTHNAETSASQLETQKSNENLAKRASDARQALGEARTAQTDAAKAQQSGKPADAASAQAQAQEALTRAEGALRGESQQANGSQQKQTSGSPQQSMQQAAQAAQEAAAVQGQAAQGNAKAAAQAAKALSQAAQSMAQANAAKAGQPSNKPAANPDAKPGDTKDQTASANPAGATGPKEANHAALYTGPRDRPEAISASDWAKLGPLQQQEFLNASQQGGPPGYQAMIKNYYIRLARMQSQGTAEK